MLAEINKAVKALTAAGNNKTRIILFSSLTPYRKVSWIAEFNIATQQGYFPSVLKSGMLAKHIVDNITPALKSAVAFEVVSLDNLEERWDGR